MTIAELKHGVVRVNRFCIYSSIFNGVYKDLGVWLFSNDMKEIDVRIGLWFVSFEIVLYRKGT